MAQQLLQTPLAIVGMACRLPGAANLTEYWDMLRQGRDAISEMPPDRLDRSLYFHPEKGQRGKTYSTLGGFIPDRPLTRASQLLAPADFNNADRCHQIFCEVALDACEHSGMDIRNFPLRNTGVYVGHSAGSNLGGEMAFATLAEETLDFLFDVPDFAALGDQVTQSIVRNTADRLRRPRPKRQPGGGPDFEAHFGSALVAKALKLTGPNFVIDAACASSLVALAAAALALNHGSIDAAIVGGASYNKGDSLILFSHAHSCSARGTCPFDSQADGLISSEGYVALVVKLLPRAIADGDTVHAVIRGLGISSDGRGRSLWAPRKEGQIEAIRRAYGPGVDARNIQFIEAHATSTQVGDATELEALAEFFTPLCKASQKKILIGSVKSNIGHTLETAGLAGLLKTTLALRHGQIPPTVHIRQLHPGIPWDRLPFRIPTQTEPWPEAAAGHNRCGAVNAFGIGGLNVHVVVEEYVPLRDGRSPRLAMDDAQPAKTKLQSLEPIAIIGRGAILPGARGVADFAANLCTPGKSLIQDAPESRWRKRIGVSNGTKAWSAPLARGGFITDYAYDWKTNKIPPKQVAQANPLQFMLLDAAREALAESGYDRKSFDSLTTAVVVGSIFGGEFGNHLTIGLRLPEIKRDLCDELIAAGKSRSQAESIVKKFEDRLLEAKPALIDETGSFTSSTLASRVAKTLNLMGGAMAIDAGDCSSLAALQLACDLLRSKANSLVFCAAAQRAMDLPAFESLALHGRLMASAGKGDEGYLPGEGVALLLLKRLEDAERDGDRVLGVIEGVAAGMDATDLANAAQLAGRKALESSRTPASSFQHVLYGCGIRAFDEQEQRALRASYPAAAIDSPSRLIRQMGHTQAAHGLASIIQSTIESPGQATGISVHASSGLTYHAVVSPASRPSDNPVTVLPTVSASQSNTARIIRFSANSEQQLFEQLGSAALSIAGLWSNSTSQFAREAAIRMAIVANSPNDLAEKISLVRNAGSLANGEDLLRERGIYFSSQPRIQPRLAFVFPGQGSQHAGMLRELVDRSAAARQAMAAADQILAELGFASFAEMAWQNTERLGVDVWTTQMAVLIADYLALAAIGELGFTPDCVVGHSFGEFAALVAADAIDLRQAIKLTDERARAVEASVPPIYGMLSIKASLSAVESYLNEYEGRLFLSHHNSPEQIVLGGVAESLEELEANLAWKNIPARRLQVPTAYHTPLMQPMLSAWSAALARERIRPPRILLLSSVTNKYVADPDDIRENLATQLVTPVHYVQLLKRLVCDQIDAIVEVGPNQVLTQLHRRTLHDRGLVITSLDHPKRNAAEQVLRLVAELECLGWQPQASAGPSPKRAIEAQGFQPAMARIPIEHFDATSNRKSRRRNASRFAAHEERSIEPVVTFDATERRRSQRRQPPGTTQHNEPPSSASVPTPAATTATSTSAPAVETNSVNIDQILIDFVVEHTGYPANLINFDWDMEADLGIDSIKRAQLFGELRDMFHLQPTPGGSLDDYRTLRQIADLIRARVGASQPSETTAAPVVAEAPSSLPDEFPTPSVIEPAMPSNRETITQPNFAQIVIQFVVDQTGYPPEVVDIDADFEADLGIDSIKKAQLFGELRDQFGLTVENTDRLELAQYRTVRQILQWIEGSMHSNVLPARDASSSELTGDDSWNAWRENSSLSTFAPRLVTFDEAVECESKAGEQHPVELKAHSLVPISDERYQVGLANGRRHAQSIRRLLRRAADRHTGNGHSKNDDRRNGNGRGSLTADDLSELQGLADGAEVHFENVLAFQFTPASDVNDDAVLRLYCEQEPPSPSDPEFKIAHRYILRTVASPQRSGTLAQPKWIGAAVIFGKNDLSEQIRQQFVRDGKNAYVLEPTDDPQDCVRELDRIWHHEPVPHLFITTPRDPDAVTTWSSEAFDRRRRRGVTSAFWFCQRWVKLAISSGLIDSASMVGVLSLGGDFGFERQLVSVESGAIAGLFKSIIVENWVAGFRTTPIKLIDVRKDATNHEIVGAIWRELAVPSYDCEIAWNHDERRVVRAIRQPITVSPRKPIQRGEVWVCTGGARGITAFVAQELAKRYDIQLHLLGLSPIPSGPHLGRTLTETELRQLKIDVMQAGRERGLSPVKEWDKVEKSFEIHRTLDQLRKSGVTAHYHSCDVADRESVAKVLTRIREMDGPIHGILHGAGVGKDARFDRKEPDRVEQCIRAKVDGARTLMELTSGDPLGHFVAFGSISGRFGANGHTDYSLANDMLCKLMDWYRAERPEVHSVGFHWHAWGDVGMAMKPETKLALEMVGMQFMPAAEGLEHLVNELETRSSETEILITDDKYYRLFYPAETLAADGVKQAPSASELSLLRGAAPEVKAGQWSVGIQLDPTRDTFLVEHRLDDRPLLPIVIGVELLAEAAVCFQGSGRVVRFHQVEALQGLKFFTDRPQQVNVRVERLNESVARCELVADFRARDGRLVEANRVYLKGDVELGDERHRTVHSIKPMDGDWHNVEYAPQGSKFYLGSPLRRLKQIQLEPGRALGKILAPSLIELAGSHRQVESWIVPSAAIDACLYATGLLCWSQVAPGATLPVSFGTIELGRLPDPGEACDVEVHFQGRDGRQAVFDFVLCGVNGDVLVRVTNYRIAWIGG